MAEKYPGDWTRKDAEGPFSGFSMGECSISMWSVAAPIPGRFDPIAACVTPGER